MALFICLERYHPPAMRTLMIDMPSGVAGDMLLGALLGCGADLEHLRVGLEPLGLGSIAITAQPVMRGSLSGLLVAVAVPQEARWRPGLSPSLPDPGTVPVISLGGRAPAAPTQAQAPPPDPHQHRPYAAIRDLIAAAGLPARVARRAQAAFALLATAEGVVHGISPELVEFHEVGALDAIVDVVATCLALEQLDIESIVIGPLQPGQGTVRCAHGLMPVPVPAVAAMLQSSGAPCRTIDFESGELTTPTGAALVLSLAGWDRRQPSLAPVTPQRVVAVGYGAGSRDSTRLANVVRCTVLEDAAPAQGESDQAVELTCQVDDATGESLGYLLEEALRAGALDAYLTPVVMKKGRPGHLITLLGAPADRQRLSDWLLTQSSSIGVRWQLQERRILPRSRAAVTVDGHVIALKVVVLPDGSRRAKPEAEAVASAARALNRSFTSLYDAALRAWHEEPEA